MAGAHVVIRRAVPDDAPVLARHRASMFHDMGSVAGTALNDLRAASEPVLREWLESGQYAGFVAARADDPSRIVGGAGVHLRPLLPRPAADRERLLLGVEGVVLNVFVEPTDRRQGIARQLMQAILAWAPSAGIVRLVLHASDEGRPLYESMGFAQTNELRYTGTL
jgi:GNAT superfamily N-acetyltransferase